MLLFDDANKISSIGTADIPEESLDVMSLTKNPNYLIHIQLPDSKGKLAVESVKGFLTQEINIMGSAEWSSPWENVVPDQVQSGIAALGGAWNLFTQGNSAVAQRRLKTKLQTVVAWTGTDSPIIFIPLLLVAFTEDVDVRQDALKLFKGIYPQEQENEFIMLTAPYSYTGNVNELASRLKNRKDGNKQLSKTGLRQFNGTVSINIGKWLFLRNMVIQQVDVTLSKESIPSGNPFYARINLTVRPAMMWTVDDIEAMFMSSIELQQKGISIGGAELDTDTNT